jgi:hypothetical protein
MRTQHNQDKSRKNPMGIKLSPGKEWAQNYCSHCQRKGNCEDKCWKLHPELRRSKNSEGPEQKKDVARKKKKDVVEEKKKDATEGHKKDVAEE